MNVPHSARRLLVALIALAAVDPFVPVIRDRLEAARYEHTGTPMRFENSDLFGIGPLVQYLREHPQGARPRTVFVGNSVLFGYGLDVHDTVPAVYERLSPGEKVFNVSINALETASAYLITKAVVDSVDRVFMLTSAGVPNDQFVGLVPIADEDLQRFKLPFAATSPLSAAATQWRLYRDTYRIQAGLFGTSTRQYVYLHKGEIARGIAGALTGRQRASTFTPAERESDLPPVTASIPVSSASEAAIANLEREVPLLVDLARLFRERRKHLMLIQIRDYLHYLTEESAASFNAAFAPHAVLVIVDRPASARLDTTHFNREGAAAMAQGIRRLADAQR
jgi:hypothetical protein